ncbi:hypothetical protein SAMN05421720_101288 [Rhodospira trueperi]|uniref:Uncharacterized protein n=1 Tax=Rhodospira trueperi TaxID=69960 RepID=A0A1G6WY01_9PROT|nr:hypothetical protein SAMN05421720_101288 [Rhodospira trueperi]
MILGERQSRDMDVFGERVDRKDCSDRSEEVT